MARTRRVAAVPTRTLTTTEAAVLALLALEGRASAYDLLKHVGQAIAYVWAPAKTQLYTVLPRLARDGLVEATAARDGGRPEKQVYGITVAGREALTAWHESVEPDSVDAFHLRLFVGGLTSDEVLIEHVEQFRRDVQARLDELRRIEPSNTRQGHDRYHYFLLRLGIERREHDLRWADEVLAELRADVS
jgi:DNA-binding PadR family transcriptional regulator